MPYSRLKIRSKGYLCQYHAEHSQFVQNVPLHIYVCVCVGIENRITMLSKHTPHILTSHLNWQASLLCTPSNVVRVVYFDTNIDNNVTEHLHI